MNTKIYNLATGEEQIYSNDFPAVENLVTTVILQEIGALQIHNTEVRKKYHNRVQHGLHGTAWIEDWACFTGERKGLQRLHTL